MVVWKVIWKLLEYCDIRKKKENLEQKALLSVEQRIEVLRIGAEAMCNGLFTGSRHTAEHPADAL